MKVFIAGGSGFVGSSLAAELASQGSSITILTRFPRQRESRAGIKFVVGDPTAGGPWQDLVAGHDTLINLAGSSIFCLWTRANRKAIRDSRITITRNLVAALSGVDKQKTTLINASAVGYYGNRQDEELNEDSLAGDGFLAEVVREWEAEARQAEKYGARVLLCRFGVVLGRNGGALSKMLPAFRLGLGSPLGSGRQWFPWIHIDDLVSILLFLSREEKISGPVNCAAPNPATNRDVSLALGRILGRPVFLPAVPAGLLRLLLGEFATVFLDGQKVMPEKLLASGFVFQYPEITEAFIDLLAKPKVSAG